MDFLLVDFLLVTFLFVDFLLLIFLHVNFLLLDNSDFLFVYLSLGSQLKPNWLFARFRVQS